MLAEDLESPPPRGRPRLLRLEEPRPREELTDKGVAGLLPGLTMVEAGGGLQVTRRRKEKYEGKLTKFEHRQLTSTHF